VSAQSRSKGLVVIAGAQWIPKDERRLLTRAEFIFGMKVGDLTTAKTLSELVGHAVYDEVVGKGGQNLTENSVNLSMENVGQTC
jgi:hypothetical protein